MTPIHLFTIGFTKKTAEVFFTRLQQAGVKRVVDVRLNNNSQLAGFSKRGDLAYFLKAVAGIEYVHVFDLALTQSREVGHGGDPASHVTQEIPLLT